MAGSAGNYLAGRAGSYDFSPLPVAGFSACNYALGSAGRYNGAVGEVTGVSGFSSGGTAFIQGSFSLPVTQVTWDSRPQTVVSATSTLITISVGLNGQYGVDKPLIVNDASGALAPFQVTKTAPESYSLLNDSGNKAFTANYADLPDNSILANSEKTYITVGDQMIHGDLGISASTNGLAVLQEQLTPGNYAINSIIYDASSNYQAGELDIINLTVLNNSPNSLVFPPVINATAGQVITVDIEVIGLDAETTMYKTSVGGEISNDGGSSYIDGDLPFINGLSRARLQVTAGNTPGEVVTGTITIGDTVGVLSVTTASASNATITFLGLLNPNQSIAANVEFNVDLVNLSNDEITRTTATTDANGDLVIDTLSEQTGVSYSVGLIAVSDTISGYRDDGVSA